MFAENTSAYFRGGDFASPLIYSSASNGTQHAWVLFDEPDADILGGRVQTTQYKITYQATELVGLTNDDQVLIGVGKDWKLDSTCSRLVYCGSIPPLPQARLFQVLGTPKLIENGALMEAQLESVS